MMLAKDIQFVPENQSQSKKNNTGSRKAGFMAVLHKLEEQFYGPETNKLSGSAFKVLLFIRHQCIRNWVLSKKIDRKKLLEATGLSDKTAQRALRELENTKFIRITRSQIDGVWQSNTYELHPERFGTDIHINIKKKPTLKVIHGFKNDLSNNEADTDGTPTGGGHRGPAVDTEASPQNDGQALMAAPPSDRKNPSSKEPFKKNPFSKIQESLTLLLGEQKRQKTAEEQKREFADYIRKQGLTMYERSQR